MEEIKNLRKKRVCDMSADGKLSTGTQNMQLAQGSSLGRFYFRLGNKIR